MADQYIKRVCCVGGARIGRDEAYRVADAEVLQSPGGGVAPAFGRPRFAKHSIDDDEKVEIAVIDPDCIEALKPVSLMECADRRPISRAEFRFPDFCRSQSITV